MRPSRRMLPRALSLTVLAGLLAAGQAFAQFYDPALRSLDLRTDVPRSPRLLGMGGLSLSVPDRWQKLDLWSFAGSPIGVYGDDSVSTLQLRPGTGSASGLHDAPGGTVREDLAGRASEVGFEAFHRDGEGTAWGAAGNLQSLRADQVQDLGTEARRSISVPSTMPIMTGPFPYWGAGKLLYAARLHFARERLTDEYRQMVSNAAGEFLSQDGTTVDPPSLFEPTDVVVRRTGAGLAAAYPVGRHATLAAGYDVISDRFNGENAGTRSQSQVDEKRPYGIAQATLVGRLGRSVEYAFDERHWTSSSQQNWFFSVSAGVGAVPLLGRGKLLQREESGNATNSIVRVNSGSFHLAGRYWTDQTRVTLTPPDGSDPTSFNRFLSRVYYRVGADTLALPDSVVANEIRDNSFGYGAGASWTLKRGVIGVEYHFSRRLSGQALSGEGPRAIDREIRAGIEHRVSDVVTARVGGGMLWRDPDDFLKENEQRGQTASVGLGVMPAGAHWGFELGWDITWLQSDYGDPLQHRESHQRLQSLLNWSF
jgi:hypothetical protein